MRRLAFVSAVLLLWGCASAPAPLPSDLHIVPPTSGAVPAQRAAFSGSWTGTLDSGDRHTLVVEEIEGDDAVIVVAFATPPGWVRVRAGFDGPVLKFTLSPKSGSRPALVAYRVEADGSLTATMELEGRIVRGRMSRGDTRTESIPKTRGGPIVVPLPTDLRVTPPDASVPKELGALSGQWSGTFEVSPTFAKEGLRHVLVVEELSAPSDAVVVVALYASGLPELSGWVRRRAVFDNGVLKVTTDKGTLAYRVQPDGGLLASIETAGLIARAHLSRGGDQPVALAIDRAFLPLPADVRIVRPGPAAHRELAAFSGQWLGTWEGVPNKHTLVVEEIYGIEAVVVFAATGKEKPVSTRTRGIFVDGVLKLLTPRTVITYRMQSDGTVLATMTTENRTFRSRMTRVGP
jgi:hypothetical protein